MTGKKHTKRKEVSVLPPYKAEHCGPFRVELVHVDNGGYHIDVLNEDTNEYESGRQKYYSEGNDSEIILRRFNRLARVYTGKAGAERCRP